MTSAGSPAQPELWGEPSEDVLVRLTRRCLEADGGLPLAAEPWFVRSRWLRDGTRVFVVRTAGGFRSAPPDVGGAGSGPAGTGDIASGSSGDRDAGDLEFAGSEGGSSGSGGVAAGSGDGEAGRVVAAVSVRAGADGPVVTGMVDPDFRGRGIGARLLEKALEAAVASVAGPQGAGAAVGPQGAVVSVARPQGAEGLVGGVEGSVAGDAVRADPGPVGVTLESEGLSVEAAALFESRGFRQVFAEDVMRIGLGGGGPGEPVWASGAEIVTWGAGVEKRFHAVYAAAFRERPGFPDPSAEEWIEETVEEDDFRADWSLLVSLPGLGDVGFVTATEGWIVQVGVVPAARGTGLGAALISESLRRAAAAGFDESWLCVNVDNPAAGLYRRLGFQERGRRARFRRETP